MIAEGDAYSRVNETIKQKDLNIYFNKYGGAWLPLYFSMMVSALSLLNNSHITPRLITLVFSLSSCAALYFYTKEYTKDKIIALLSSFIYLIFPLRLFLSTQTLSETIFIFFLLVSFTFLLKEKLNTYELILTLLFVNIAHGIRYESWIILPLIWIIVLSRKNSYKVKSLLIFSSTLFPLYWLYLNQIYTGNYLTFFNVKYEVAQSNKISQYSNFYLSYKAWRDKLIPLFQFHL
ncbi:MAG: glycosyltransferase family 39 protein [Ignavibacteriae bacterium]|nr:glycosyltransferase family 39 protein [Ignavibacteriota bacterium]